MPTFPNPFQTIFNAMFKNAYKAILKRKNNPMKRNGTQRIDKKYAKKKVVNEANGGICHIER